MSEFDHQTDINKSRNRSISFSVDNAIPPSSKRPTNGKRGTGGNTSGNQSDKSSARSRVSKKESLTDLNLSNSLRKKLDPKILSHGLRTLSVQQNYIRGIQLADNHNNFRFSLKSEIVVLKMSIAGILELDLSENRLERFLDTSILSTLQHLKKLSMNDNIVSRIQGEELSALADVGQLEVLDMSNNKLEYIPPEIGRLTTLTNLKLNNNKLVELPKEIIELHKLYMPDAFSINKNNLISPQQLIAQKGGLPWIRAHFKMINPDASPDLTEQYFHNIVVQQFARLNIAPNLSAPGSSSSGPSASSNTSTGQANRNDVTNSGGSSTRKRWGSTSGSGGGGSSSGGTKSFQMKLFVVGHEGSGKSSLVAKLLHKNMSTSTSITSSTCTTKHEQKHRRSASGGSSNHSKVDFVSVVSSPPPLFSLP